MRRPATKASGRRPVGEPMSLRFSPALRARVKRYALLRGLEEATAVRALCAERLRELDLTEDLHRSEQWQRQQAIASWDRLERGELATVPATTVRRLFAEVRAQAGRTRAAKKK